MSMSMLMSLTMAATVRMKHLNTLSGSGTKQKAKTAAIWSIDSYIITSQVSSGQTDLATRRSPRLT
jgi:hypothetical protein